MSQQTPSSQQGLSRRRWFAGAGTVGAVAAVAAVAPVGTVATSQAQPEAKPSPERGGGYTLSEHVKRYYQTTRV
ncbi:formate dehydrogenase [Hydrogenophaga aquatica]